MACCAPLSGNLRKIPPQTTDGGRRRAARDYDSDNDDEVLVVVAKPLARCAPLRKRLPHTTACGRRCAARKYDSDDDDKVDVAAKPLAHQAPADVDARRARLLPKPPNNERHNDDNDKMNSPSLPPLPNIQNIMIMVHVMEQRSEHPSMDSKAAFEFQATTLEEQYDDSMDPCAIILGDLRDCVSFPPIIDFSRIEGSDFNDCDNDNKQK